MLTQALGKIIFTLFLMTKNLLNLYVRNRQSKEQKSNTLHGVHRSVWISSTKSWLACTVLLGRRKY